MGKIYEENISVDKSLSTYMSDCRNCSGVDSISNTTPIEKFAKTSGVLKNPNQTRRFSFISSVFNKSSDKRERSSSALLPRITNKRTRNPLPVVHIEPMSIPPGHGGLINRPTRSDVLCGKGDDRMISHRGNIYLRQIVHDNRHEFVSKTTNKLEKANIAARIVEHIRELNPPGRFLKKAHEDSDVWIEIGDEKARKKVSQALREDAAPPELRVDKENTNHTNNNEMMAQAVGMPPWIPRGYSPYNPPEMPTAVVSGLNYPPSGPPGPYLGYPPHPHMSGPPPQNAHALDYSQTKGAFDEQQLQQQQLIQLQQLLQIQQVQQQQQQGQSKKPDPQKQQHQLQLQQQHQQQIQGMQHAHNMFNSFRGPITAMPLDYQLNYHYYQKPPSLPMSPMKQPQPHQMHQQSQSDNTDKKGAAGVETSRFITTKTTTTTSSTGSSTSFASLAAATAGSTMESSIYGVPLDVDEGVVMKKGKNTTNDTTINTTSTNNNNNLDQNTLLNHLLYQREMNMYSSHEMNMYASQETMQMSGADVNEWASNRSTQWISNNGNSKGGNRDKEQSNNTSFKVQKNQEDVRNNNRASSTAKQSDNTHQQANNNNNGTMPLLPQMNLNPSQYPQSSKMLPNAPKDMNETLSMSSDRRAEWREQMRLVKEWQQKKSQMLAAAMAAVSENNPGSATSTITSMPKASNAQDKDNSQLSRRLHDYQNLPRVTGESGALRVSLNSGDVVPNLPSNTARQTPSDDTSFSLTSNDLMTIDAEGNLTRLPNNNLNSRETSLMNHIMNSHLPIRNDYRRNAMMRMNKNAYSTPEINQHELNADGNNDESVGSASSWLSATWIINPWINASSRSIVSELSGMSLEFQGGETASAQNNMAPPIPTKSATSRQPPDTQKSS